jgi:regulator of sirC expression with transglutaminase-like and TPR domain
MKAPRLNGGRRAGAGGSLSLLLCFGILTSPGSQSLAGAKEASESSLRSQACRIDSAGSERTLVDACQGMDELVKRARLAMAGEPGSTAALERLNRFFFRTEGFQVTHDLSSLDHLLPGRVIAGKTGYCVGLAAIYLILAEDLGLPVHAVATPQHVFLRWDDGKLRRNIELFQEGGEVTDEQYVREQKIPRESVERGVFMKDLARDEFLGFIHQNLGVLASQSGDFQTSAKHYAVALHLNRKLAAAHYNLGNDLLQQKRYREAARAYSKALDLYPTDAEALQNRSVAWEGLGKLEKAKEDAARAQAQR